MLWTILISVAFANDPEPQVIYKQKTEIDFEGFEIEGELFKPEGALISERQAAPFNPLIQLRTNFQQEMSQSVQEVK